MGDEGAEAVVFIQKAPLFSLRLNAGMRSRSSCSAAVITGEVARGDDGIR
jgi:hypothetical protein